jgi:hypothetical protein
MNLLKQIFGQKAHWQINKDFAKSFGIECAILISDLVDKNTYFNQEWFFNTAENIENDTTLSRFQQDKAIKILIENGFIETKLMGIPAKKHFKINENNLLNFFNTINLKSEKQVCEKLTNYNSNNLQTINNNKDNKNKEINIYSKNQNLTGKQLESFYNVLNTNPDIKKDFEELPKPLNIDTEYYNAFLEKWNLYGSKYKDRKVKLSSLQQFDKQNLKTINKSIEEISKALFILFNQNNIIESCLVTPKHFLLDFQKYYQAGLEYEKSKNLIQFYKPKN